MSSLRNGKITVQQCSTTTNSALVVKQSISSLTSKDRLKKQIINYNHSPSLPLNKITCNNSPTVTTTNNRVTPTNAPLCTRRRVLTNNVTVTRKTNNASGQDVGDKQSPSNIRLLSGGTRRLGTITNNNNNNITSPSLQQTLKSTTNNSPIVKNMVTNSVFLSTRKSPAPPVVTCPFRRETHAPPVLTRKVVASNNPTVGSKTNPEGLPAVLTKYKQQLTNSTGNDSTRNKQSKKVRASTLSCNSIGVDSTVTSGIGNRLQEQHEHSSGSSNGEVSQEDVSPTANNTFIDKDLAVSQTTEIGKLNDELTNTNTFDNHLAVSQAAEIVKLKEGLQIRDGDIERRRFEIHQLKKELHLRDGDITTRNSEVNQLKQQLQLRDKDTDILSSKIQQLKEQLLLQDKDTEARNSEIQQLKEQLLLQDKGNEARNSEIQQLKEQLFLQDKGNEARNSEIQQLKEQLLFQDKDTEANRNSEIQQLKEQLLLRDKDIEARNSEIQQLKEQLLLRDKDTEATHKSEIQQLKEQLLLRDKDIEARNSEIKRLNDEVHERELDVVSHDHKISQLENQLKLETSRWILECNQKNQEQPKDDEEKTEELKDIIQEQEIEIAGLKERIEHLEEKLVRQARSIKKERCHMKGIESDVCIVVRCADERWMTAESKAKKAVKLRNQAELRVEELEHKIDSYEEDIAALRGLLQQKPEILHVGVQVNSAAVRYGTENNNNNVQKDKAPSKSTVVSVIGEGDKENHVDNSPVFLLSNGDDFENFKEVEKSVIKPLTHADSKRNTLFSELDPLGVLAQSHGGSRRKALLAWSQQRTSGYAGVDIDDFSTCWSNGVAFCALLHSYLPNQIPFDSLQPENPEKNLTFAFKVAETIGVTMQLDIQEMLTERPSWQRVMNYLSEMYNCLTVL